MLEKAFLMLDRSDAADPLSDILSLLKPRSIACGAIDAGDACIAFPAHHGIKCHAVIVGEAWLVVDGVADPLRLAAGDFFILPHGLAYSLASDLRLAPVDYRTVLAGRLPGHVLSYNGGGRATIISVTFTIDDRNAEMLLSILPSIVHLRSGINRPSLDQSLQQMMQELRSPQPGSRLIVEHLTTMMLAQALRAYPGNVGQGHVGWLFALADKRIGATIGAMHADPSHRWTVQDLAKRAGMGRTSFSTRFKDSVGFPPMEYLTRLRMMLASDRLSTSNDAVNVVAEAVGYDSESAFSKACKRYLGCAPRRYAKSGLRDVVD
jgi:AraC-like DNA-binding protein